MKILASIFILILFFSACKKHDSGGGTTTPTITMLAGFTLSDATNHTFQTDTFLYDNNYHLVMYQAIKYDSTQVPVIVDSLIGRFLFTGNDQHPVNYTFFFNDNGFIREDHQLFYDPQNRVVMDTLLDNSQFNNPAVTYFIYAGDSIIAKSYYLDSASGKFRLNETNSYSLKAGNVTGWKFSSYNYNNVTPVSST